MGLQLQNALKKVGLVTDDEVKKAEEWTTEAESAERRAEVILSRHRLQRGKPTPADLEEMVKASERLARLDEARVVDTSRDRRKELEKKLRGVHWRIE